ncbi:MAG: hypothetical protein JNM69_38495 [Archangium sp.]|nr:hypothetical protein [Archangium sp.]
MRALRRRVEAPRRWWLLLAALVLISSLAWAQLIPFTADTPARASEVNSNFQQLKTWLEQKVGTAGTAAISATGLNLNNNRITNVAAPVADTDVVTKAHLKALFANHVIWVTGGTCPTGFVPYPTAEGRYPLGEAAGSQGVGGVSSIFVATQQQQSAGSGYAKTGVVALGNNIGGFVAAGDINDVQGGWTYRQSTNLDIRPVYVLLKPCIFNPAY